MEGFLMWLEWDGVILPNRIWSPCFGSPLQLLSALICLVVCVEGSIWFLKIMKICHHVHSLNLKQRIQNKGENQYWSTEDIFNVLIFVNERFKTNHLFKQLPGLAAHFRFVFACRWNTFSVMNHILTDVIGWKTTRWGDAVS